MTKNIVFGGNGFLGLQISNILSKKKKVIVIDKKIIKNRKNCLQIKTCTSQTKNYQKFITPNSNIFYFADIAEINFAKNNPDIAIRNNILNLLKLLNLCKEKKVKNFFYASTVYVYNEMGSFYRVTKQCAEIILKEYCKNFKFNYVFFRYGSIYGTGAQEWNGFNNFVKNVKYKNKIVYKGSGKELREYIHVKDAAKLTCNVAEQKKYLNKSVLISGQNSMSVDQAFSLIFEILGKKKNIKYLNKISDDHYGISPYRYMPDISEKIVPSTYIDIGQGILEIVKDN